MKTGSNRSLSTRLLQAQDEERRRISRELHDSVGQILIGAKMALGRIRASRKAEKQDLEECLEFIEEAIREVRSVSYLLHPPMLDLIGLGGAIRGFVEGFNRRSKIRLHLEIPEKLPRLSTEKETAAYRMIQECLTNAHRYSGASNLWVRVHLGLHELRVEVQDDGKGIATADLQTTKESEQSVGVGISGMRERVRELGGTFAIRSSNRGTHVIATIPIAEKRRLEANHFPPPGPKRVPAGYEKPVASRKRILVADDHEIMRRGIRVLIENTEDLEICGEAETVVGSIEMIRELKPDVVLLDLHLLDGSGWQVLREIRAFNFWTKVLIFTAHNFAGVTKAARAARCEGFLTKLQASSDLVVGLRTVLSGHTFYPEEKAASETA